MTVFEHRPAEGVEIFVIAYDEAGREQRLTLSEATEVEDRSRNLGIGRDGEIVRIDHGPFVAAYEELKDANTGALAAAIKDNCFGSALYVDLAPPPVNEDLLRLDERYCIDVRDDQLVAIVTDRVAAQPSYSPAEMATSLARIAEAYECAIVDVWFTLAGGGKPEEFLNDFAGIGLDSELIAQLHAAQRASISTMAHDVHIALMVDPSRTASALIGGATALSDFISATKGGPLDAAGVLNLLRGGHYAALIGEVESDYLEVKTAPYTIWAAGNAGGRAKIELAQDVARFANGDVDAVLVIGYREARTDGSTKITALTPVRDEHLDADRIKQVLDERIVPAVDGLVVERFAVDDSCSIMAIHVPRQPPEMRPYLVHGAIVSDRVEGAFFSIVRRRGEASITTTAQQIHAYIVAGKRYLRGNQQNGSCD